jgi:exodeoxyribonuclease V alpha subunit
MLRRNLFYTAITRARELVVIVGQRRAIHIAVSEGRRERRFSGLRWRLQ